MTSTPTTLPYKNYTPVDQTESMNKVNHLKGDLRSEKS